VANRTFYPSFSYGSGRVFCDFAFNCNNTSNPLTSSLIGVGVDAVASLARSGTGVIVVAMKDAFVKCIKASAELDDSANDGSYATVGTLTNEGTSSGLTFTIRTRVAAGTLTDFTARKCGVSLVLKNGNWGTV